MTNSHRTHTLRSSGPHALTELRAGRRKRAQARDERRQLERELASYTTMADVDDLFALLRGQDETSSEAIRTVVLHNMQERQRPRGIAS